MVFLRENVRAETGEVIPIPIKREVLILIITPRRDAGSPGCPRPVSGETRRMVGIAPVAILLAQEKCEFVGRAARCRSHFVLLVFRGLFRAFSLHLLHVPPRILPQQDLVYGEREFASAVCGSAVAVCGGTQYTVYGERIL